MAGFKKRDLNGQATDLQKPGRGKRSSRLSMKARRSISGYLFIMPFIIGFLFFMVSPLFMSLEMSFSRVNSDTIQPNNFYMDSYLGYGPEVKISREIALPENLRFDPAKYRPDDVANSEYIVERIDEVLTLDKAFAYGYTVPVSRKIALPSYVWYNPYDLQAGKYNVEPVKPFLELGSSFSYGTTVELSRKIQLPSGYQYNKYLEQQGVYAVELADSILALDKNFKFGEQMTISSEIDLPEGYSYLPDDEATWIFAKEAGFAFGEYVSLPEEIALPDGYARIPAEDAQWFLAQRNGFAFGKRVGLEEAIELPEGLHFVPEDELRSKERDTGLFYVAADDGEAVPLSFADHLRAIDRADILSKLISRHASESAAERFIVVAERGGAIPLSFADHLIEIGRLDLLVEISKNFVPKNRADAKIIVADNGERIPLSFAVHMFENGYSSQLKEAVEAVMPGTIVRFTKASTFDKPLYEAEGKFVVKGAVPADFAAHLIDAGHLDLFAQTVAAVKGMATADELNLPEFFTYDHELFASKKELTVQVAEDKILTLPADFNFTNYLVIDEEITLPEGLRYLTENETKWFFAQQNGFSFGKYIALTEEITLPEGYSYLPAEEVPWFLAQEMDFDFGLYIYLSEEIPLPEGYHFYTAEELTSIELKWGNLAIYKEGENGDEKIPVSFGDFMIENGQTELLEKVIADYIPANAKSLHIVQKDDGKNLDVSFADYMFANGYEEVLLDAVHSYIPTDLSNTFVVAANDGALIPVSFAVYLLENGHYDLLKLAIEARKPEVTVAFSDATVFDKALYEAEGVFSTDAVVMPDKFAVYLLTNKLGDIFYETIDEVAESTDVCFLYKPEYDENKQLVKIGTLPTDITCDMTRYENEGIIAVKLDAPQIPLSFMGTLMSNGLFFETFLDLVGLDNYVHMLTVDPKFNQLLIDEVTKMILHTIAILVVSFVIAILLNQEFKGRALVRAIFFLPVILSSGMLVNLEADNTLMQGLQELIAEQTPFTVTDSMMEILRLTGLGGDLLDIIFDLIAEVYDIVMASGIQIVVFLSGLQNVPASLYEAADVEGCTKWEAFWKITFPLVSPLLIVNIIYTIIDFFTKMGGDLSRMLNDALLKMEYDHMSAMSWSYFLVTLALIGVSALIVSKVVASDE